MVAILGGVLGHYVLQLVALELAFGTVLVQILLPVLMERTALTWEVTAKHWNASAERNAFNQKILTRQ